MPTNNNQNIILRTAVTVTLLLVTVTAVAVPALRRWTSRTLHGGSTITVTLSGDEYGRWYVDQKGGILTENADGTLSYASEVMKNQLRSMRRQRFAKGNNSRSKHLESLRRSSIMSKGKKANSADSKSERRRGLVVLIDFPNRHFSTPNPLVVFNDRFNRIGYNEGGLIGSVHDYFYDQSYGNFDIEFDIIGPLTLSRNSSYYGNNTNDLFDAHPTEIVTEAIEQLRGSVDFSIYDWDKDGEADQILFIHAGMGEHISHNTADIWAHESELQNWGITKPQVGNIRINTYAITCELADANGTIDGIGTACHEFAHCLGFPDFYDVDYSGGVGMQQWSLLAGGSYNGPELNGEVPAPFTSYERWQAGWLEPAELSSPCNVSGMKALVDAPEAYIIYNNGNRNEYFLLENHQASSWDSYTTCRNDGTGHGLLILHVDYNAYDWAANTVNDDPQHQRMTFVSASNSYLDKYSDYPGQLFPGTSANTSFTDSSSPAATTFSRNTTGKNLLGKPLTAITENNGLISFCFMANHEPPVTTEPLDIGGDYFTATWTPVLGATSYVLTAEPEVDGSYASVPASNELLLSEDFNRITSATASNITANINTLTSHNGWDGVRIYGIDGSVRIGTSSSDGFLVTPPVIPSSGKLTVAFKARKHSSTDGSTVLVFLSEPSTLNKYTNADGHLFVKDISVSTNWSEHVLHFDFAQSCGIFFEGTKRVYFDDIKVFDGYLTEEEVKSTTDESPDGESVLIHPNGSITIKDIHTSSYSLTGLAASAYRYRVRAVTPDGFTGWSNYTEVHLSPTTITSPLEKHLQSTVYSVTGQHIGINTPTSVSGIYIINGKKHIK